MCTTNIWELSFCSKYYRQVLPGVYYIHVCIPACILILPHLLDFPVTLFMEASQSFSAGDEQEESVILNVEDMQRRSLCRVYLRVGLPPNTEKKITKVFLNSIAIWHIWRAEHYFSVWVNAFCTVKAWQGPDLPPPPYFLMPCHFWSVTRRLAQSLQEAGTAPAGGGPPLQRTLSRRHAFRHDELCLIHILV